MLYTRCSKTGVVFSLQSVQDSFGHFQQPVWAAYMLLSGMT
jgi:hypothetical protein